MSRDAGPGRLRHRMLATVAERGLWSAGDRVAVAVSGGRDSVALLDLLVSTQGAHGGQLSVVTVDHGTRADSGADADFAVELARARGLPCIRVDAALGPGATELACRVARLAAFEALDVDRVALAHHRDDQAETLLLQLLRGAGTRGLGAMRWRTGRLVRPLLEVPRAEIDRWCAHRELAWCEDPTNASPQHLRNRVRAEVLPLLEQLRPGAAAALARSAGIAAADDAWLEALVEATPLAQPRDGCLDAAWVAGQPGALVGRALQRVAPQTTAAQVQAIRAAARRGSGSVPMEDGAIWEVVALDGASKVVRFRTRTDSSAPQGLFR